MKKEIQNKSKHNNRTYCGDINDTHSGKQVYLYGWIDAIRDHGQLLFIHLRDISGLVQVVFNIEQDEKLFRIAFQLKEEYVVSLKGNVRCRAKGTENPSISTGDFEIVASDLTILSESRSLPFKISEKAMIAGEEIQSSPQNVDEDLRLQYRFLDLRRPSVQDTFIKRHQIIKCIRTYLDEMKFLELETPVLTKSTPEGARDYLVPSRIHTGKYYALPQSPQLFKQLFMVSGLDRYYQIVKCFRDEDLRPNRQPEFTQLDLEASFIDEEFIYELIEELIMRIFSIVDVKLKRPFPQLTYDEAMNRYGTDAPDLRFGMDFKNVTEALQNTNYTIFRKIIANGGSVKGFCIKGQSSALSKNVLQNEYALKIVPSLGGMGMTWMRVVDGDLDSNIVQFFSSAERTSLINLFEAKDGDVLIMVADSSVSFINKLLGKLRIHMAQRLNIIPQNVFCPVWITDFPLFELVDDKISSTHHPFTSPDRMDFDPLNQDDVLSLKSRAYDLVVNGVELGGGSIRINDIKTQQKIFLALGMQEDEIENKFGFFLKALEYGAPPHGGLALGLDRVLAMALQLSSIRDVIPFPKNRRAVCPLTEAPSVVDKSQLKELKLDQIGIDEKRLETGPGEAADISEKEQITESEVRHVAKLARLRLDDNEIAEFRNDLNSILDYVGMLAELDTENVLPMHHVLDVKNVWREDKPVQFDNKQGILSNTPEKEDDYLKVPKILEG